jgi:hypothetical protein
VEWLGCGVRMDVERRVKKIQVGKSKGGRKEKGRWVISQDTTHSRSQPADSCNSNQAKNNLQ